MKTSLTFYFVGLIIITYKATAQISSSTNKFCWLDTFGRGVGYIPASCPPNTQKLGLLCYQLCPAGFKRVGLDCHSICPSSLRDDWLFCRAQYGRGAGMLYTSSCQASYGKGNCQKCLLLIFPKCQLGFSSPNICQLCKANNKPNCTALSLLDVPLIPYSCAKVVKTGVIRTASCAGNDVKDAGLCYPGCKAGFTGIGPLCWKNVPTGWVNCGMGAAKSSADCATVVFSQVTSVGSLALKIATLGGSSAITNTVQSPSKVAQIVNQVKDIFAKFKGLIEYAQLVKKAKTTGSIVTDLLAIAQSGQFISLQESIRISAMIASLADPTGIASVVAAYTYPKCSSIGL